MKEPACFRITLAVAAVLAIVTSRVSAQDRLFDYRLETLENGLNVITLEDFSCPIVAVQIWYHVGSKDEQADRQGFAHMFEHMMFRGTDRLGPTDHFELVRQTGGTSNAYTSFDQTVYHEILPANQLELALWLESERMSFLKIDQESYDTERKVVEEERRMGLNRPYGTMMEQALAELFQVHPYRWTPIGKIPHLRAAAVGELRAFWNRYYVPNNATLVIVGAVKHDRAQALAKRYFGWIPRYDDPRRVTAREPEPSEARSVTIQEAIAPAPIVGVAYLTASVGDDDNLPMEVLGTILGSGQSSRLYRQLVAENQLAVQVISAPLGLEHHGVLLTGAVLPPVGAKTDEVLQAIQEQIETIRTELVTEHELTKVKNQMLRNLVTENLTIESKASLLGRVAVLEADAARVNHRIDEIRGITREDVLRVARKYFPPERAMSFQVQRNLVGTVLGGLGIGKKEEDAPITAEPEQDTPPPGRPGLVRPSDYPPDPPVQQSLDDKPVYEHRSTTLANGLRVIVVPNHEIPFATIQLGLLAGAWTESKPGTASMAMQMLTRGTAKHSEGELADELETYAVELAGYAGMDSSTLSASCVVDHLDRATSLMAEVLLTPSFVIEEFEKLRTQVRTGLVVSSKDPNYLASREFRRRLYGSHPYARTSTGEFTDLDVLHVDDLRAWWQQFVRPDMAVLIFAGDIQFDRAVELAESHFAGWPAPASTPETSLPPLPAPESTRIFLVDHRGGVQSQIRAGQIGITRTHPDYFTSRVVSGYFGGAFNSRLNETIRVARGLTYGARGGYSAQKLVGEFQVSTFTKTASTAEAVQAVLDEIERLRTEPPTSHELQQTKSYALGSFARERETPQQVAGDLWLIQSHGLPEDYIQQLLDGVAQTREVDCTRLVQNSLDPEKLVIVVVGDADKLKEELEKIAPVTVVDGSS